LSYLARIRQQQHSWGRSALGLFVAVWLNLAVQPCAMAFEVVDDDDCLHCPPAQVSEHDGMHGNMDQPTPCADAVSDCAIVEDLNYDGRSGQIKLKDTPADIPVAIAPYEFGLQYQNRADTTLQPLYASVHAGAPPPLHVLHCVYLK